MSYGVLFSIQWRHGILAFLLSAFISFAAIADKPSHYEAATIVTENIVDADSYARLLISQIEESGKIPKKVHVYWVGPTSHPTNELVAVLRVLFVHFRDKFAAEGKTIPRDFINGIQVPNENFHQIVDESVETAKNEFLAKLEFSQEALENSEDPLIRQHVMQYKLEGCGSFINCAKAKLSHVFHPLKTNVLHFLGSPNGIKVFTFIAEPVKTLITTGKFSVKTSRDKFVKGMILTAIQAVLTYKMMNNKYAAEFGGWLLPAIGASVLWSVLFNYDAEASLKEKMQGVTYKDGRMDVSSAGQWFISILHSLAMRGNVTFVGHGLELRASDIPVFAETSVKGTAIKAIWEKMISKIMDKEKTKGPAAWRSRVPEVVSRYIPTKAEAYNYGFQLFNSVSSFADQFRIVPGLRTALLAVAGLGMGVQLFINEKNWTKSSLQRLAMLLRRKNPKSECRAALVAEYE